MALPKLHSVSRFRPACLHSRAPARFRALSTQPQRTIAQLLDSQPEDGAQHVVVNGYVRSVRTMKSEQFVNVGDGSSRKPLQALVPRHMDGGASLRVGAAVRLRGSWAPSQYAGQSHELKVDNVDILGPSDAKTLPIQNKYQTPEYLRTIPHLRSRIPFNTSILRLRSEAIATLTQFFASRSFVQTQPPIITSSDCEGAGEVFTVSTGLAETPLDPSLAKNKTPDLFFRSPKYLTVSTQLHLEALAQSLGNVWTLSPTFRAEKSDTSRHMSEFYMLEAEMTFVDEMDDVMNLLEDMLGFLTTNLYKSPVVEELLNRNTKAGDARTADDDLVPADEVRRRWAGMMQNSSSRWPRITYTEAIRLLKAEEHRFEHKPDWGVGLQSEHEKFLATTVGASSEGHRPVFVTHYPRDIKAFYMRPSEPTAGSGDQRGALDPHNATVDCFDLIIPDLCEIAGGSMREHRLGELLEAMSSRGMVTPPSVRRGNESGNGSKKNPVGTIEDKNLDWYVDLRRWGSPPHGGFGLGFDRLLSYLTGVQSVRDVVAFPRWYGRCDC